MKIFICLIIISYAIAYVLLVVDDLINNTIRIKTVIPPITILLLITNVIRVVFKL